MVKIKGGIISSWYAFRLGPYIDWQEWNIWHHEFTFGIQLGPWDWGIILSFWDVEDFIDKLKTKGMTREEAWDFCDKVRNGLPDPYSKTVNLERELERALQSGV